MFLLNPFEFLRAFEVVHLYCFRPFVAVAAIGPEFSAQAASCLTDWNDVHQRLDGFGASSAWRSTWTTTRAALLLSTTNGIGLSRRRNPIAYASSTSASATPTIVETNLSAGVSGVINSAEILAFRRKTWYGKARLIKQFSRLYSDRSPAIAVMQTLMGTMLLPGPHQVFRPPVQISKVN